MKEEAYDESIPLIWVTKTQRKFVEELPGRTWTEKLRRHFDEQIELKKTEKKK